MSRSRHGGTPRENSVSNETETRSNLMLTFCEKGLGLKQFYGEELDRELQQIREEISTLKADSTSIAESARDDAFLDSDDDISNAIDDGMERADSIRTLLLEYKKDGRSCKATNYNDVLKTFIACVQLLESSMIEYEQQLRTKFDQSESVMSVKQVGDTHYLIRENPLDKYGYGREEDRIAKLEEINVSIAQIKAMLVGLEFLAYSADKCDT